MSIAPLTRFPNGPVCSVFTSKTLVDDISRYENNNCLNVRLERGLNAWTELQMSCDDQGIPKAFTELELNILRVDSSHRNFGIENKIMSVRLEIRDYEAVVDADWITKSTGWIQCEVAATMLNHWFDCGTTRILNCVFRRFSTGRHRVVWCLWRLFRINLHFRVIASKIYGLVRWQFEESDFGRTASGSVISKSHLRTPLTNRRWEGGAIYNVTIDAITNNF